MRITGNPPNPFGPWTKLRRQRLRWHACYGISVYHVGCAESYRKKTVVEAAQAGLKEAADGGMRVETVDLTEATGQPSGPTAAVETVPIDFSREAAAIAAKRERQPDGWTSLVYRTHLGELRYRCCGTSFVEPDHHPWCVHPEDVR